MTWNRKRILKRNTESVFHDWFISKKNVAAGEQKKVITVKLTIT